MDDDDTWVFAFGTWFNKITGAAGIGQGFADYSLIALGQDIRMSIIVFKNGQDSRCSSRAACKFGELFHEFTAVHAAVGETIEEVDIFLVHDGAPFPCL